jgi:acetyl esterase
MPIDDETRSFLDASRAKPAPPPGAMPLEEFRNAVEAFRALGFEREDLAAVDDVEIPVGARDAVKARVYTPEGEGVLPVVVWAHGGSWVRVTVDLLDGHFRVWAKHSRCVVVAVDYGLAPESRFPSALEEVLAAGRWTREEASARGWDADRIGIGGESSGANIAAAVTLLDRARQEACFAHQTLVVPVLDARFASPSWDELGTDYLLTRAQLEWAVEQYAPGVDRTDPLLSPACAEDLTGLPPALIVTGEYDPLRDEGAAYARRLSEAGVRVRHVRYPGLIHHAIMVPKLIALGARLVQETATTMCETLRSGSAAAPR